MPVSTYVRVYGQNAAGGMSSVSFVYTSSDAVGASTMPWGQLTGQVSTQTDITTYAASSSHVHSASDITSSTLAVARIASGTANVSTYPDGLGNWKVPVYTHISSLPTLGTSASTNIDVFASATHFHGANSITTSTFAVARMGTGTPDSTKFLRGDGAWEAPVAAAAWGSITGSVSTQTDITSYAAASTHFHSASAVTTSTFAVARLGTGTPDGTNYLRGDGTWASVTAASNVSNVVLTNISSHSSTSAMALAGMAFTVGALSSYAFKFGVVFATAAAGTGYKVGLVYPAVSTFAAMVDIPIGAAGPPAGVWHGAITASGGVVTTTTVPLASTQYYAEVNGIIHPSSAGTLQLHIGTEIAGSAQSTFAGTFGQLTKLTP